MQARKVSIGHGWLWIKQGLQLIFHSPLLAVVLAAIVGGIIFLFMKIPALGPLLGALLLPVMVAGYMKACRAMERHEEAEVAHLFAGFGKHAPRLIALGGALLVGVISTVATMSAIGGEAFMPFIEQMNKAQEAADPEMIAHAWMNADPNVMLALLTGLTLFLAISVCLQFAPMLVLFNDEKPLAAVKSSLMATLRNIWPYAVYSLILQMFVFAAGMLPLLLAIVLVLAISMTSLYAAYQDLFGPQPAATHEDAAAGGQPQP